MVVNDEVKRLNDVYFITDYVEAKLKNLAIIDTKHKEYI